LGFRNDIWKEEKEAVDSTSYEEEGSNQLNFLLHN
jgi:hypothetical protein